MSIHIVSFDIGKKNFAFSISKVYKSRINKLTKFPKKERYNVDGTTTPEFEKELKKLYKCSQTVLVRNTRFASKYGRKVNVFIKDRDRKQNITTYRSYHYPSFRITNNMVAELFELCID